MAPSAKTASKPAARPRTATNPAPISMNRQQRRQLERTKVPSKKVLSNDLVIEEDGVEYRPHAGESVLVRGGNRVGDVLIAMRLQGLVGLSGNTTPEEMASYEKTVTDLVEYVAERIEFWDWTDANGDPYPTPPTPEVLRQLDFRELAYLATAGMGSTPEAAKNG